MLPTDSSPAASNGDQLNGWKEIAAHLGKSVRAAQRWERELGLPVHRIKTVAGQAVFASRREIDDWRRTVEAPRDEAPPPDVPTLAEVPSPVRWTWWARAAVFVVIAAAVVGRRPAAPDRVRAGAAGAVSADWPGSRGARRRRPARVDPPVPARRRPGVDRLRPAAAARRAGGRPRRRRPSGCRGARPEGRRVESVRPASRPSTCSPRTAGCVGATRRRWRGPSPVVGSRGRGWCSIC